MIIIFCFNIHFMNFFFSFMIVNKNPCYGGLTHVMNSSQNNTGKDALEKSSLCLLITFFFFFHIPRLSTRGCHFNYIYSQYVYRRHHYSDNYPIVFTVYEH